MTFTPTPEQLRDFAEWCQQTGGLEDVAGILRDEANRLEHERNVENLARVLADSAKPCVDLPDGQVLAVARVQARAVLAFQAEERAAKRLAEKGDLPPFTYREHFVDDEGRQINTLADPGADPAEAWDREPAK
ncbi:hypothetical protein [Rhodococcus sp. PD04]|uniref:hypothetical protein n=1 Tax=Rhodococcus sp. PD04 TaxID=3109594 RepID=UPI002DDC80FA|nr:hypothetical protein [Rhodococcus sp. PD04]WSE22344.1 hypothetical protein U9J23_22265 [Rhodococcus sp. PD04]